MTRVLLLMVGALGWSGTGPSRWSEPAFNWWRRSVRRSLAVAAVVTVCVVALPLLIR